MTASYFEENLFQISQPAVYWQADPLSSCTFQDSSNNKRQTVAGAKPYKCPQCPSSFRSSSNLRAHLRTHTGHTPYLCPQCGRGFKEITHLKRHLVSHRLANWLVNEQVNWCFTPSQPVQLYLGELACKHLPTNERSCSL